MMTIWKYSLAVLDHQVIRMPRGAMVLTVQAQNGEGCLWALVDVDEPMVDRIFAVFGTGHFLRKAEWEKLHYIGTYQMLDGVLIWHVFEVGA